MEVGGPRKECAELELALENQISDFGAAYMAICDLHALVCKYPEAIGTRTVSVIRRVLERRDHASQKVALFFYKEAANALAAISVHENIDARFSLDAVEALKNAVAGGGWYGQRAAAEAMGSLPLSVHGQGVTIDPPANAPCVSWKEILHHAGLGGCPAPEMRGRSLVVPIHEKSSVLVVKLNRAKDAPSAMCCEAAWMEHLQPQCCSFPVRFDIPSPLKIRESYLFRVQDAPIGKEAHRELDEDGHAIGFIAHKDYFTYVNDPEPETRIDGKGFREVMSRNAWLLGKLASLGIIHCAPIPLFHNRVQTNRRADHGLYEWPRGGRLDRWIYSCRHPNLGLTGLRDFEHFEPFCGRSNRLYEHIGSHLLSLLLVTGSYFRNKHPQRVGYDTRGKPVDARELFDKPLLESIVCDIFGGYYEGFVGAGYKGEPPFECDELSSRMIEEMGVDRHMEEILRAVDQQNMTEEEFGSFLVERGYSADVIARLEKGAEDIVIPTGPHLGGFNQRISLPEVIEFVAAVSAVCMADRYLREKKKVAA